MGDVGRAAVFEGPRQAFSVREFPLRPPEPGELLVKVRMSTLCRSDIHTWEGKRPSPTPGILGHEIIGTVAALGDGVERFAVGDRVGVPWLGWTCGECSFCRSGLENLCAQARFTGYQIDGGYGEFTVAELAKAAWVPRDGLSISVKDGVVDLNGVILEEKEREALRVVAENVPGVRAVEDHLVWIEPVSGTVIDPPQGQRPPIRR